MKIFLFLCLFLSAYSHANDLSRAPKGFSYGGGKAIYVDFTRADYDVIYDMNSQQVTFSAKIQFIAGEEGNPLFDLVQMPTTLKLDGMTVAQAEIKTPNNETTLRVVQAMVAPGEHTLEVTGPMKALVQWNNGGVSSAFWTTDLDDRGYLEQFLPANMEFDQVQMNLQLHFVGGNKAQKIYTNGVVRENGTDVSITYPAHYTSSSVFFHTVPEGVMSERRFVYRSVDGRELPGVVYLKPGFLSDSSNQLRRMEDKIVATLQELEGDYGAFLHPSITVYNAGSGGMEYCGATMSDYGSVGHELTHSYFARGIMPANGNSGWIDEALASWRDGGYNRNMSISGRANMAGRAPWTRYTDMAAYTFGARFMGYLDGRFASVGGLKPFLRQLVENHAFEPYSTEDFISWGEGHYRADLSGDFHQYVYGGKASMQKDHPVHKKMGLKELAQFL